jgi:hypothetical protein
MGYKPEDAATGLTDTQVLREAARLMRERAQAATSGPWYIADCEMYPRWILAERHNDYSQEVAKAYEEDDFSDSIRDEDWEHMVPMGSPPIALAVADLLDAEAAAAEAYNHGDVYNREALAIARAYLPAGAV